MMDAAHEEELNGLLAGASPFTGPVGPAPPRQSWVLRLWSIVPNCFGDDIDAPIVASRETIWLLRIFAFVSCFAVLALTASILTVVFACAVANG